MLKPESHSLGKASRELKPQSMLPLAKATRTASLVSNQEPFMSRDIANPSDQETSSPSNPSHESKTRAQHVVKALERDSAPLGHVSRNAKDCCREFDLSNQQTLAAPKNCSSQTECQFCDFVENSHLESRSVNSSASGSALARTFAGHEPQTCEFAVEGSQCELPPICVDPECSEIICEECSDHDECCEYCVEDYGSDCGVSIDCEGPHRRIYDDCAFAGYYSELFGDQAVETFGLGCCLPQLPMEAMSAESSSFGLCPNTNSPALDGHKRPEISDDEFNRFGVPMQSRAEIGLLEVAETANADDFAPVSLPSWVKDWNHSVGWKAGSAADGTIFTSALSSQKSSNSERITAQALPASPFPISAPLSYSADPAQNNATSGSIPPPVRCQWADPNGQPCGRVCALGNDLHKHLQTVHGVKSEVFCRWLGCSVSILGATPHKYANSVQRHTWGHSGYRPYKCPICSEGFAAANAREEHFTNFHLRRKMFACDICTHQCTSATNLKRHKDEKHRAERFQCEFCNRNGKVGLFPRGSNLARHFRRCKYVLALFPEASGAAVGKIDDEWFPPGYMRGHHGMDRAKITPPKYLPIPNGL